VASATALRGPDDEYAGTVVVLDDLTELLKAQRVAAWREVAQRIAHEIKNPLTPIQLSAQRLRRRLARTPGEERLVLEATETIIRSRRLKRLVDEFSHFARMPVLQRRVDDVAS
jgi:two-component system nitrogen regulation sensor histidine kinase NtrY